MPSILSSITKTSLIGIPSASSPMYYLVASYLLAASCFCFFISTFCLVNWLYCIKSRGTASFLLVWLFCCLVTDKGLAAGSFVYFSKAFTGIEDGFSVFRPSCDCLMGMLLMSQSKVVSIGDRMLVISWLLITMPFEIPMIFFLVDEFCFSKVF